MLKRVAIFLLQLLVSIAGLWWVFHDPHKRAQIVGALRHCNNVWLAIGFGSYGLVELLATIRWQRLLRIQNITLRWLQTFSIVMIGLFFNLFLPGLIGGDVIRLYFSVKLLPQRKVCVALSIVMDRLLGLCSIVLLAAAAIGLRFHWLARSPQTLHITYIALGLLGLGLVGALALFYGVSFRFVRKLTEQIGFRESIKDAAKALKVYRSAPTAMSVLFLITIASHLAYYLSYYCAVQSLQPQAAPIPTALSVLSIMPLVNTITSVPISVGGLGVRETLFQQLLSNLAGVSSPVAAFGASLGFVIQASRAAAGAATYLLWRRKA